MSLLQLMAKPSGGGWGGGVCVNVTLTSLCVWIKPHSKLQACALYLYVAPDDSCSWEIFLAHHTKVLSEYFHDDEDDTVVLLWESMRGEEFAAEEVACSPRRLPFPFPFLYITGAGSLLSQES